MRDDRLRFTDIRAASAAIERCTSQGEAAFLEQEPVRVWTGHHLVLIGEAARAISPVFRDQHPAIPWAQVIGLQNILVHQYFNIDPRDAWAIVERDLPALRSALVAIT
jgi:uncharacterized protein with HEPN domain